MPKWIIAFAVAALPVAASAQQVVTENVEPLGTQLEIAADAGTLQFTNGDVANGGFAYGFRVGLGLSQWLSIEGRYLAGTGGGDIEIAEDVNFNSGSLNLKAVAASRYGRIGLAPYVTAGVGVYRFRGGATEGVGALITDDTSAQIPVGVGLQVNLNENVALGGEFQYHFLMDDDLFQDPSRAATDVWDATANLTFRL